MKTYFFKSIPISIIGIIFSFQATQFVHAAEVPCSNYSASLAGTCTQCFDEGSIYRGEAVNSFKDTYINSSPNTEIMFEDTW